MKIDNLKARVKQLDRVTPPEYLPWLVVDVLENETVEEALAKIPDYAKNNPEVTIIVDNIANKLQEQQEGVQAVNES